MKPFLIAYTIFVLVLAALLAIFSKQELFVLLNSPHSSLGDTLFPYITYLGGGVLSGIVVIAFLFLKYRLAIIASFSFLLTGIVVQTLKHTVFSDALRPMKFFEGQDLVQTVPDLTMYMHNSFPSGHTATVFSLFLMLSLALNGKKPMLSIAFFMLAVLGGYSRIYLGQHFPADVLAGSGIGVGITLLCYKILDKQLAKKSWSDKGLVKKEKG